MCKRTGSFMRQRGSPPQRIVDPGNQQLRNHSFVATPRIGEIHQTPRGSVVVKLLMGTGRKQRKLGPIRVLLQRAWIQFDPTFPITELDRKSKALNSSNS